MTGASNSAAISPIIVFRERADAIARLVNNHFLADKQSAIDGLWRYAEGAGVVDDLGVDRVQEILSEAFKSC